MIAGLAWSARAPVLIGGRERGVQGKASAQSRAWAGCRRPGGASTPPCSPRVASVLLSGRSPAAPRFPSTSTSVRSDDCPITSRSAPIHGRRSVTNAAKHAIASAVAVEAECVDGTLRISVRDDGIGGTDLTGAAGCSASRPASRPSRSYPPRQPAWRWNPGDRRAAAGPHPCWRRPSVLLADRGLRNRVTSEHTAQGGGTNSHDSPVHGLDAFAQRGRADARSGSFSCLWVSRTVSWPLISAFAVGPPHGHGGSPRGLIVRGRPPTCPSAARVLSKGCPTLRCSGPCRYASNPLLDLPGLRRTTCRV